MDFIRARNPEQIISRQEEIIAAARELFVKHGYDAVHFKAISEMTSLSRPALYSYYKTKDEVLLGLLQKELKLWYLDLNSELGSTPKGSKEDFSLGLARNLNEHPCMLDLFLLLFSFLEKNSRQNKLIEFKKEFMLALETFKVCTRQIFPEAPDEKLDTFIQAALALVLGLYPLSKLPQNLHNALVDSHIAYKEPDFLNLAQKALLLLLSEM